MDARARSRATLGGLLTGLDAVAVGGACLLTGHSATGSLAATVVGVLVARAGGLHRPRLRLSLAADLPGLLLVMVGAVLVTGIAPEHTGATPATSTALAVLAGLVGLRGAAYAVIAVARRLRLLHRRVLVVGTGPIARQLAERLARQPGRGLTPIGFVSEPGPGAEPHELRNLRLPLVADLTTLPVALADSGADGVVFALPAPAGPDALAAVPACLAGRVAVYVGPRSAALVDAHAPWSTDRVGDVPLVRLRAIPETVPARLGRRAAEIVLAATALALLAPVVVVLAALVRAETGRAAVVHRPAVDAEGVPVTMSFLRTRRVSATGPERRAVWRTGPIGRALRRTGLEGLPQTVTSLVDQLPGVQRRRAAASRG